MSLALLITFATSLSLSTPPPVAPDAPATTMTTMSASSPSFSSSSSSSSALAPSSADASFDPCGTMFSRDPVNQVFMVTIASVGAAVFGVVFPPFAMYGAGLWAGVGAGAMTYAFSDSGLAAVGVGALVAVATFSGTMLGATVGLNSGTSIQDTLVRGAAGTVVGAAVSAGVVAALASSARVAIWPPLSEGDVAVAAR